VTPNDDLLALRDQCDRFLTGHGPVRAGDQLATIPSDTAPDRYGDGGVVAELEEEIAALLGKPAAVFFPSGTMAQQSVLRVHADRRGAVRWSSTRCATWTGTRARLTSGCTT